ncbi:MAG TPA: acyl-CoA dehydrogenase family protein [Acidimicrobiales bacterium]|nr:acyl-CoA dehydrogenase family protein [Acidimicrobiales bacterium]
MEREERELLDRTLARVTAEHSGPGLDAALDALGWSAALATDPATAVALLFEHQGRAGATSGALDDVLADALGVPTGALVLPDLGQWDPPGRAEAGRVDVAGLATCRLQERDTALVPTRGPSGMEVVELKTSELQLRGVDGIDPGLGLTVVTGGAVLGGSTAVDADRWAMSVRRGRMATGHELVGLSAAMLELARSHALDREQFGRPIASFQAVRHRLADTFVAVESARSLLLAGWEDGSEVTAAMAKAVAGRVARTAMRHCQQVLAGIGFTTEHPLHRYVRRALVLDELFGSSRTLTASLGRDVLAGRQLPPALPL